MSYTAGRFPDPLPVRFDLPAPEATGWTKHSIDKLGELAATRLGYEPGGDLVGLVEKIGGEVITGPADRTGTTGFLEVPPLEDLRKDERRFRIVLSPYPGEYRNRFTIAHELAHFFLHSKGGKQPLYATRQAGSRVEWEANWFAAAFLMPSPAFVEEWNRCGGRVGHLINHFLVSGGAVEIRRDTLREFGFNLG